MYDFFTIDSLLW